MRLINMANPARDHSVVQSSIATPTMLQSTSKLVSTRDRIQNQSSQGAQTYGLRQKAREDFVASRRVATQTLESEVTCSKSIHIRIFERTVIHLTYYSYSYINN